MKYHPISVDQARYTISVVVNYLYTATFKTSTKFYNTTFPSDMILTKDGVSTNDNQVDNLTRDFNIHYRSCMG